MKDLTTLFHLLEHTRSMPQYGYVIAGLRQDELSNLAEHHYLVTFIAWQLAVLAQRKGGQVDIQKVLEFSLIHDLGELFGGDIAMPYAKANPEARKHAKAFEAENHKFLSEFFGEQKDYFQKIADEVMDADSDECIISKLADYMECTHFKHYMKILEPEDLELAESKMGEKIEKISDPNSKEALSQFISEWIKKLPAQKSIGSTL